MSNGERESEFADWNLDHSEAASVHEVMVEAGAWQLIELTMDTADRAPSLELVEQARADIRANLAAHDAAVRESVALAIEAEAGTYPHDSIVQVGFREAAAIARDASQETP